LEIDQKAKRAAPRTGKKVTAVPSGKGKGGAGKRLKQATAAPGLGSSKKK
jgi:hypothetical protein